MNIKKLMGIAVIGALFCASSSAQNLKPGDLSVADFLKNPLGMNLENMSFNWKLPPAGEAAYQSAYAIEVATSKELLERAADVWQSGKTSSARSVQVPYGGRALKSCEKLWWRVKIWSKTGQESDWSEAASFETSYNTDGAQWAAHFIKSPHDPESKKRIPPAYLRRVFNIDKPVKAARLYAASKGIFTAALNGDAASDQYWPTGWTDYKKRIQIDTYDVTKLIKNGANCLSFIIADGWFSGSMSGANKECHYGTRPEIIAILKIDFADGTTLEVPTDASWKSSFGGVSAADFYDGETYDADKEPQGWKLANFDDSAWSAATASEGATPLLEARRSNPIRTMLKLKPLAITQPQKGVYVYDLGQNMVGTLELALKAWQKNSFIKIRFAEMLNKDGTLYTENYRNAESTDHIKGAPEGGRWTPLLTYHGFRYVELSNMPEGFEPSKDDLTGLVWYSDMAATGAFSCSDERLNRLQSCILWGQRGNFLSVPTDCPQRDERLGWTGDAQVFAPTAAYNMDVAAFFTKWLLDLRDTQNAKGAFSDIAPTLGWGFGNAAWGDAGVVIPWEMYLAYGGKKTLEDNYEAVKKWIEFQKSTAKDLIRPESGYGDWLQPFPKPSKDGKKGDTPKALIGTAYFARGSEIAAQMARILDKPEDAAYFEALSKDVKAAFVKRFVDADGKIECDSQTAYLLALGFDLLPENLQSRALKHLEDAIKKADGHLRTGFVGTPLLTLVLTKFGRTDLAYEILLKETYPSWLFTLAQGATTMWERWNSYTHADGFGDVAMNSFNHYAYGAIGKWMYATIGGLSAAEPGYKTALYAAEPGGGISRAETSLETPYGLASSSWKIDGGKMFWHICVAPNAYGKIIFPVADSSKVKIDGLSLTDFAKAKNLELKTQNGRPQIKSAPSGSYKIEIEL